MNNLQLLVIENVKCCVNQEGVVWFNAADVATNLGWTQVKNKLNKPYTSIRWEKINNHLARLELPKVSKSDFISEDIVNELIKRTTNNTAKLFNLQLNNNIYPQINKLRKINPTHTTQSTTFPKIINITDTSYSITGSEETVIANSSEITDTSTDISNTKPSIDKNNINIEDIEDIDTAQVQKNNLYLQIFTDEQLGQLRTIEIDGQIWFVAVDICRILDIRDTHSAIKRLKRDERYVVPPAAGITDALGKINAAIVINESGLYRLLFTSNKPEAERLQWWTFHKILPSIRKYGTYSIKQDSYMIEDPIKRAERWIEEYNERLALESKNQQLTEEKNNLNNQVKTLEPKAKFYDIAIDSDTYITVQVVADVINISRMGRNNLFKYLREKNIIEQNSNLPLRKYIEKDYFKVVEIHYNYEYNQQNINRMYYQTFVSQRGLDYIIKLLIKDGYTPKYRLGNTDDWKDALRRNKKALTLNDNNSMINIEDATKVFFSK